MLQAINTVNPPTFWQHVWQIASSPPIRVLGWIPYELILTAIPHLLPSATQLYTRNIEELENSENTNGQVAIRINELIQRVYSDSEAPDITLLATPSLGVSSSGGFLSLQSPTLVLPEINGLLSYHKSAALRQEAIVPVEGAVAAPLQEVGVAEEEAAIILNKEETEFFILRETLRVKYQASLIRTVGLLALFGLAIALYHLAIPSYVGTIVFWAVYLTAFRKGQYMIEERIDKEAHKILKRLYERDLERPRNLDLAAYTTMLGAYKKQREQNKALRESSWWRKLYILPNGNDLWEMFSRPAVSSSIAKYTRLVEQQGLEQSPIQLQQPEALVQRPV